MQMIDLEALYASLIAEIDVFILLERQKEAEGVFSVITRLIRLHGADDASLDRLFSKLKRIPNAHTYAQNIAYLASTEQLRLIATARETTYALARIRQTPVFTQPPLFG